jgi:hypothetical protein
MLSVLLAAGRAPAQAPENDLPPTLWFPVGEVLSYNVYWGMILVGRSTLTSKWVKEDGQWRLAIQMRTQSNRFLASLYPVDGFTESIVDPETFLPVRFTEKSREGRHLTDEITRFDHARRKATWKSYLRNREKTYAIDADTRDLLSFMYNLRRSPEVFQPGRTNQFRVMADRKIYDLKLLPLRNERVELPAYGKVPSTRFEPEAQFNGLFVRKGKLSVWASQDDRRIMTQATAKIPVASVRIQLSRVSGPGNDDWVRKTVEEQADEESDEEAGRADSGASLRPCLSGA